MNTTYITAPYAPLYQKPFPDSELADEALFGTQVTVIEHCGEFFKVETDYRYSGYVHGSHIGTLPDGDKMSVIKPFADIMSDKSIKSQIILTLPRGSVVTVSEKCDGWFKVSLSDRVGFIREGFLSEHITKPCDDENVLRQSIIKSANSYLGVQYRWGGRTPYGIDCSGLCSSAYLQNGIVIYRDAKMPEDFPVKVIPYSQLKPADLIYSPGHIMMYIGNGKMIHSSCSRFGVVIDDVLPEEKATMCGSIFTSDH